MIEVTKTQTKTESPSTEIERDGLVVGLEAQLATGSERVAAIQPHCVCIEPATTQATKQIEHHVHASTSDIDYIPAGLVNIAHQARHCFMAKVHRCGWNNLVSFYAKTAGRNNYGLSTLDRTGRCRMDGRSGPAP